MLTHMLLSSGFALLASSTAGLELKQYYTALLYIEIPLFCTKEQTGVTSKIRDSGLHNSAYFLALSDYI